MNLTFLRAYHSDSPRCVALWPLIGMLSAVIFFTFSLSSCGKKQANESTAWMQNMDEQASAYRELLEILKKVESAGSTADTDREAQEATATIKELKEKLGDLDKPSPEAMSAYHGTEASQEYLKSIQETANLYNQLAANQKSSPALDLAIAELNRAN